MSVDRIRAIRKKMEAQNLDGILVTNMDQVRYLTGFTGSSGLLVVGRKSADFITDSRYTIQASRQVKGARVHLATRGPISGLTELKKYQAKNLRLGFAGESTTIYQWNELTKTLPGVLLIESNDLFLDLGWVKTRDEIGSIKKAVDISDVAFERILNMVSPGIRESELAAELEYQMAMLGSERPAFESIVASGERSALPHGIASKRKLKKGDFITFDFGATVNGYVSDITRTVVLGKATSRQKKIYGIVLRAQQAGIRKVKAGVTGASVDAVCRNTIKKAGFGKYFGHGTGHGIGYVIHTGPRVSPLTEDKLLPNNVITIEPGIYLPGWGGVRIEDDVLVTRSGRQVLNQAPKKLLEL